MGKKKTKKKMEECDSVTSAETKEISRLSENVTLLYGPGLRLEDIEDRSILYGPGPRWEDGGIKYTDDTDQPLKSTSKKKKK